MALLELAEAKQRLSIDFDTMDEVIKGKIDAIEGYLYFATGIKDWSIVDNEAAKNLAKEYVGLSLYLDYYSAYSELEQKRLTAMIKQLQMEALITE